MARTLRRAWARFRRYEPARLRAGWVALVALLATQGISVSTDVDGRVQAVLGVLSVLLPVLQGELTRGVVYSPASTEKAVTRAAEMAQLPGVDAERAATTALDMAGAHMRREG